MNIKYVAKLDREHLIHLNVYALTLNSRQVPILSNKMTQENVANSKKMKHLFLLFLKQFEVDEYKFLMSFLQLVIDKYNMNPSTLFGKSHSNHITVTYLFKLMHKLLKRISHQSGRH